jgi:hypothetical protein
MTVLTAADPAHPAPTNGAPVATVMLWEAEPIVI